MDNVLEFLQSIVSCAQGHENHAFMKLLVRGQTEPTYIRWLDVLSNEGVDTLLAPAPDTFFSPHLYDTPGVSGTLLSTRTIAIDTGEADLAYLPLTPSVVVQSSPTRTQSYFIFDTEVDEFVAEQIATSLPDTDLSSVGLGHLMRLPNSLNTKYSKIYAGPHRVQIIKTNTLIHKVENLIPSPNGIHRFDPESLAFDTPDPSQVDVHALVDTLELSALATAEFIETSRNPKQSLTRLISEILKKGLSKGIAFLVAKHSANNYTALYEYHQDEELRALVLGCEQKLGIFDPREKLQAIRESAQTLEVRKEGIAQATKQYMRDTGEFSHLRDGTKWYIPRNKQPIDIAYRSNKLAYYLERELGLNASDFDTPYVLHSLEAFVDGLPKVGTGAVLSYYDSSAQRLLIHTGANNVHCITPQSITQIPNGSYSITLFPIDDIFVPFMPRPTYQPIHEHTDITTIPPTTYKHTHDDQHWSQVLFGPILDRVLNLTPEETRAVLSAWFLFLFFKNEAAARPLLALLGQPGSGKSTIMKRVCTLLYGKVSGFMSLSTRDDFDQIMSTYPLVVIDNLDTWEKWIPDALAQSAGAIDRGKRKQYTNNELFIYHRDAMVCLTAHDPKFGRADVADRLLILPMKRLDTFIAEGELLRIDRANTWAQIFSDLQTILNTPKPTIATQLRVMDFSTLGSWIAKALQLEAEFISALNKLHNQQRSFALEADQLLLTAAINYANSSKSTSTPKLVQQLFLELENYSGDPLAFHKKYRTAQQLGNKLLSSQDALKSIVNISWDFDAFNRRLWKIESKQE